MWMMIILTPPFLLLVVFGIYYYLKQRRRHKNIVMLSNLDVAAIVNHQYAHQHSSKTDSNDNLKDKLIQSGITLKEYNEAKILFAIIGLIVLVAFPILFSTIIGIIGVVVGIGCIVFGGKIYLALSKYERVEKIDKYLGTFLYFVYVIL
jgi:tight adherence protein C